MSLDVPRTAADGRVARLHAALTEEVAANGVALQVAVTQDCGAMEVSISGPAGGLKLRFDGSQPVAYVRHVVRETVNRYQAGLGVPPPGRRSSSGDRRTRWGSIRLH
jgi:hypothetical protein